MEASVHVVVEVWTPRREFLEATPEVRDEVFEGVRKGMAQLAAAGIETLGWGTGRPRCGLRLPARMVRDLDDAER
jgi:hypothetical protein